MSIITKEKTKTELIQYLHGCYFIPTPRNVLTAKKNGKFLSSPGLNNQHLLKHIPPRIATSRGHMDLERKTSNIERVWNLKWKLRKIAIFNWKQK